jgi:hypothetical protein
MIMLTMPQRREMFERERSTSLSVSRLPIVESRISTRFDVRAFGFVRSSPLSSTNCALRSARVRLDGCSLTFELLQRCNGVVDEPAQAMGKPQWLEAQGNDIGLHFVDACHQYGRKCGHEPRMLCVDQHLEEYVVHFLDALAGQLPVHGGVMERAWCARRGGCTRRGSQVSVP